MADNWTTQNGVKLPPGVTLDGLDQSAAPATSGSFASGVTAGPAAPQSAPTNQGGVKLPPGITLDRPGETAPSPASSGQPAPTPGHAALPPMTPEQRAAFARGQHAPTPTGPLAEAVGLHEPDMAENVFEGVAKGSAETVSTVGQFLHNHLGVPMPEEVLNPALAGGTEAKGKAQLVGKMGEAIAEFALGDEALKGLSIGQRLMTVQKITDLVKSSPALAKALGIGLASLRLGTAGGVQSLVHGSNLRNAMETGAVTALTGGTFEALGTAAQSAAPLTKAIGKGGQIGLGSGLLYKGIADALEPKRADESQEAYEARRIGGAIQALLSGHGIAETFRGPAPNVAEAGRQAKGVLFGGPAAEDVPELLNKITGGKGDPEQIHRAINQINTKGISTFEDFGNAFDTSVAKNVQAVRDAVAAKSQSQAILPMGVFNNVEPVEGGAPVISNPVLEAISQLGDYYAKEKNPKGQAAIESLRNKIKTQGGLNLTDINELAVAHGRDLSKFNANGELSTGVTAHAAENVRSAVKEIVHQIVPETQQLDSQAHDAIEARKLMEKLSAKVDVLNATRPKTGLVTNAKILIGKILSPGETLKAAGKPMTLDVVEKNLPKYLKRLQQLDALSAPQLAKKVGISMPSESAPASNPTREYGVPSEPALDFQESDILGDEPDQKTRGHEHGHALAAHVLGIEPLEIRTPEHPTNQLALAQGRRVHATTTFEFPDSWFDGDKWKLTPENLSKLLTISMAGLASDEIHQGVERDLNPAGAGDQRLVRQLLDDAKVPISRREAVVDKAYNAAKAILSTPHARDIILENRDVREPGLDRSLHVSNDRLKKIYEEYDRRVNEANTGRSTE